MLPEGAEVSALLEVTVTDLKQHAYCPRIPYYQYVLPLQVRAKKTYPMEQGIAVQEAVEALERRRGLRKYGAVDGRRRFGVWLRSPRLGISGRLDLMIETAATAYPVDFKHSDGPVRHNHRVQLAAYALLIDDALGKRVPGGFIYRVPTKDAIAVDIRERDREEVLAAADALRQAVRRESTPEPTEVRNRCTACEFRNFCGDIW